MFTKKATDWFINGKALVEAACLSGDTKPTDGIANGSILIEMDTGSIYMFDEAGAEWLEVAGA